MDAKDPVLCPKHLCRSSSPASMSAAKARSSQRLLCSIATFERGSGSTFLRLKAHVDAAVLAQAFVVEAIHLRRFIVAAGTHLSNLSALVVSSNERYSIWIAHLARYMSLSLIAQP